MRTAVERSARREASTRTLNRRTSGGKRRTVNADSGTARQTPRGEIDRGIARPCLLEGEGIWPKRAGSINQQQEGRL